MSQATLLPETTASPFLFQNSPIRTQIDGEQLWFVAKDVCAALEIAWNGKIFSAFPKAWQGMRSFLTPSGNQRLKVISEPAVYKLAFRSNKPEADTFTDWVASEVLPSIRKTGQFAPQLPLDISTTAERKPLEKLVKVWASQANMPHAQAWAQVNAHFNLGSITELPTHWIPDAINFVEGKIGALPKAPRRNVKALPPAKPFIPEKGREVMERVLALRGTLYRVNAEMRDIMCAPFWDNLMNPYPDNFKPFAKAMHSATWAFVMSVDKELETASLLFEAFVEAEKVLRT